MFTFRPFLYNTRVQTMSVHPSSTITNSTIWDNVTIGPFCMITDSIIADDVVIEWSVRIEKSTIGAKTEVLWGSVIRESTLGEECIIGCEVKRSSLGNTNVGKHPGSTIASVTTGNNVNFWSGVKFANYDGKGKGTFVLGNDVFLGCNSILSVKSDTVRTIGNGVKIGALVHVDRDIPDDALVYIDRETAKLTVREGYMKKV
jgi:bifunctional UDP-N-acetylglucosamine pyrophosphorylase / glucosamine-1-phosphate N-acetyltransferase